MCRICVLRRFNLVKTFINCILAISVARKLVCVCAHAHERMFLCEPVWECSWVCIRDGGGQMGGRLAVLIGLSLLIVCNSTLVL